MAVRELDRLKFEFLQKYSNSDLYTLIFTDYKEYPSELVKVADLEILAKTTISQIVNVLGITRITTLQDLFETATQLREQVIEAQAEEEAGADLAGAISVEDAVAGYSEGGGGGGGG